MKKNKKLAALICSVLLLVGAAGATLAWLTDTSGPVTNTFTASDINITLEETTGTNYKMVPGDDISKNPKVTVAAESEACWLFVKVTEVNDVDGYLTYALADGWTALEGETGVYYREVTADVAKAGVTYSVLAGDKVTVKDTVTKAMMDAIDGVVVEGQTATADEELAARPQLTFKAYAVQRANINDAATAWAKIPDSEK